MSSCCISVLAFFCSGHMNLHSAEGDDNEVLNLVLHIQVLFHYFTGIIVCVPLGFICNCSNEGVAT